MAKSKSKDLIGTGIEVLIAASVLIFMGFHTINFFMFIFPADKFYLSLLGFGLTSGAALGYLYIFKNKAVTDEQKTIAAVMMIISVFAEVATAGFGMQVEAWNKSGIVMLQSEIDMMVLVIQVFTFLHFGALILYYTLDELKELWGDHDGDGVPNYKDPDYLEWKKAMAADVEKEELEDPKNA